MALSQFGGRAPAGGGTGGGSTTPTSSSREIGELVQVPTTFTNASYVDAGTTITATSHPELFAKLSSSSFPVDYTVVPSTLPSVELQGRESVSPLYAALEVEDEVIQVHANGIVTVTTDLSTSVYRGELPPIDGVDATLWLTITSTPLKALAYKDGRLLLVTAATREFAGAWYSDDRGRTWIPTSIPSIDFNATVGEAFAWHAGVFANIAHFFLYDWKTKLLHRSVDGITWQSVAGPNSGAFVGSTWGNPTDLDIVVASPLDKRWSHSRDGGDTWTNSVMPSTVTISVAGTIVSYGGALYTCAHGASSAVYVFKSINNGLSWTTAATLTLAGQPRHIFIASGKMWLVSNLGNATTSAAVSSSSTGSTWTAGTAQGSWSTIRQMCSFKDKLVLYHTTAAKPVMPVMTGTNITQSGLVTALTFSCILVAGSVVGQVLSTPTHLFVFSGGNTDSYRVSQDGVNWNVAKLPASGVVSSAYYDQINDTIYVMSLTGRDMYASRDKGTTWSTMGFAYASNFRSLCPSTNGRLIALSGISGTPPKPYILGSTVDSLGRRIMVPAAGTLTQYATSKYSAVGVGRSGLVCIASAVNTIMTWDAMETADAKSITLSFTPTSVVALNGKVIAIGQSTAAVCSNLDALTVTANWREIPLPATNSWTDLSIHDGRVMALSPGSSIGIIGDGYSWTSFTVNCPFNDFVSTKFKSKFYLFSAATAQMAEATPASTKLIAEVTSPVPGTKMVVKAK